MQEQDEFSTVFLKKWREQSGKEYDLKTPEGQMAEFGSGVMAVLSEHWKKDEADPMETLQRLLKEREKLQERIVNANVILSDLMCQEVDDSLEADLSIRLLSWACHVDAFELAASIDKHRATQLEYIIAHAARELLALKVSVTPDTPAYSAVAFAHHQLLADGEAFPKTDFSGIIDSD